MLRVAVLSIVCGTLLMIYENFMPSIQKVQKAQPCLYVQARALNVREKPSMNAKITDTLPKNTKICEYSTLENGFLQTSAGYVAAQYLKLNEFKDTEKTEFVVLAKTQNIPQVQRDSKSYRDFKESKEKSKIQLTSAYKSPDETIHQARFAMESQDYKRAKTLALRINQENPKDPESWEIFAKSLYLEGNPQEAIALLQNFLSQNYDVNLLQLLEKMRQGHKI